MSSSFGSDGPIELSDADVHFLYSIVERATQIPNVVAQEALFEAYDHAVDNNEDLEENEKDRYFEFMLRMIKGLGKDQPLLDRFEQLLGSWGINIERVPEEPEKSQEPDLAKAEPEQPAEEPEFHQEYDDSESPEPPEDYAEMEQKAIDYRNQIALNKFFRGSVGHLARPVSRVLKTGHLSQDYHGGSDRSKPNSAKDIAEMQKKAEQVTMDQFKRLLQTRKLRSGARHPPPREGNPPGFSLSPLEEIQDDDDSDDSPTPPANLAEMERKAAEYAAVHAAKRHEQLRAAPEAPKLQSYQSMEVAEPPIDAESMQHLTQLAQDFQRERDVNLTHKAFTHWAVLTVEATAMTALAKRHIQRKRVFSGWLNLTLENNARVDFFVLRKCLLIWMKRHYHILEEESGAPYYAENVLLVRCLGLFVRHLRTLQGQDAAATEHHNSVVLRKTFTVWNLHLRAKYYERVVSDRFLSEAFYKWRVATRDFRHTRESERNIKRRRMESWRSKARRKRIEAENAAQTIAEHRRWTLAVRVLQQWRRLIESQRALNTIATSFRERKLTSFAMQKLRDKMAHLLNLVEMESHADYYFLTHRVLKRWHVALLNRQREHRREAYVEVRTNIKRNLARNILNNFRGVLGHLMVLEQQATDHAENMFLTAVVSNLSNWREKTQNIVQMTERAQSTYQRNIQGRFFHKWHDRHMVIKQQQQTASAYSANWAQLVAAECLRTWGRKVFQLEGHADMAEKLKGKYMKSTMGSILHHWAQLAKTKREARLQGTDVPGQGGGDERGEPQYAGNLDEDGFPVHADDDRLPGEETIHRRVQEWGESAFDDSNIPLDLNLNPRFVNQDFAGSATPGYMRTPSKRTVARSRMLERIRILNGTPAVVQTPAARVAGSAPARQQSQLPGASGSAVTSFQTKLQAQGYPPDSPTAGYTGRGRDKLPARRVDFAGFDDIAE